MGDLVILYEIFEQTKIPMPIIPNFHVIPIAFRSVLLALKTIRRRCQGFARIGSRKSDCRTWWHSCTLVLGLVMLVALCDCGGSIVNLGLKCDRRIAIGPGKEYRAEQLT